MAGAQTYVRFDDSTLSDIKVRKLMARHGLAGLGAYFATVLHMMKDRDDFDIEAVPVVAAECFADPDEYLAMLDDMADIGLVMRDAYAEGMVRSKRVYEELAYLEEMSERGKRGGRPPKSGGRQPKEAKKQDVNQ